MTLLLPFGTAAAGGVEAELEKLDAEIWYTQNQWHVGIRYEVKVKEAAPNDSFQIRVSFTEDKRPALDSKGKVIIIDVPLDQAVADGDKLIFNDVMTIDLPQSVFRRAEKVKVRADVLMDGSPELLDKKEARVKVRYEPPWEPR